MDKGKKLEAECQKYFKAKGIWLLRLYDTRSAGAYLPAAPSDYIIVKNPMEFLECKETEDRRLDISDFRPSQLKAMQRAQQLGVSYNIIVLVKKKQYYKLDSSEILTTISNGKKSISLINRPFSKDVEGLYI